MADAFFRFGTNIQETQQAIQQGLQQIASDLAGARPGDTRLFDGVVRSARDAAVAAERELAKIGNQTRGDVATGRVSGGGKELQAARDRITKKVLDDLTDEIRTLGLANGASEGQIRQAQREGTAAVVARVNDFYGDIARSLAGKGSLQPSLSLAAFEQGKARPDNRGEKARQALAQQLTTNPVVQGETRTSAYNALLERRKLEKDLDASNPKNATLTTKVAEDKAKSLGTGTNAQRLAAIQAEAKLEQSAEEQRQKTRDRARAKAEKTREQEIRTARNEADREDVRRTQASEYQRLRNDPNSLQVGQKIFEGNADVFQITKDGARKLGDAQADAALETLRLRDETRARANQLKVERANRKLISDARTEADAEDQGRNYRRLRNDPNSVQVGQKIFEGNGDVYQVTKDGAKKLGDAQADAALEALRLSEATKALAAQLKKEREQRKAIAAAQTEAKLENQARTYDGLKNDPNFTRRNSAFIRDTPDPVTGQRDVYKISGGGVEKEMNEAAAQKLRDDLDEYVRKEKERLDRKAEAKRKQDIAQVRNEAYRENQRRDYERVSQDPTYTKRGNNFVGPNDIYRLGGGGAILEDRPGVIDKIRGKESKTLLQSFVGGLTSSGVNGGDGKFDPNGIAASFGTTAKFSAQYEALQLVQQAFTDTIKEAIDYRDSLTDLNLAFGDGAAASQNYVSGLTEVARVAGANVGAALDSAARGVRAFGDPGAGATQSNQDIGLQFADAASQAAIITGKELADSRGDLIAIATSFELNANRLQEVNDVLAGAKEFGGDPVQIAQGLANGGTALQAAGFSLAEAGGILSVVTARLDQTGQTTATRLSRITSALASTAGRNLLQDLSIDPNASQRDQLSAIAQNMDEYTRTQRDRIKSTLGGVANTRELQVLLNELGDEGALEDGFANGFDNAGKGAEQAARKIADLAGTIKELQGTVSAIQNGLFDAGLFAPFAVALEVAKPLLITIKDLVQAYNELFGSVVGDEGQGGGTIAFIKNAIALYAEYRLAMFALAKFRGKDAAATAVQAAATNANTGATTRNAAASTAAGAATARQAFVRQGFRNTIFAESIALEANTRAKLRNAAAGLAPGGALRGRIGSIVGSLGGKAGIAGIGLIAANAVVGQLDKASNAAQTALGDTAEAIEALAKAATPTELESAADQFRSAAASNKKAYEGFFGGITSFFSSGPAFPKDRSGIGGYSTADFYNDVFAQNTPLNDLQEGYDPRDLEKQNTRAAKVADRQAKAEKEFFAENAKLGVTADFGDITVLEQVKAGLDGLNESGIGAEKQLDLLFEALEAVGTTDAPGKIVEGGQVEFGRRAANEYAKLLKQAMADGLLAEDGVDVEAATKSIASRKKKLDAADKALEDVEADPDAGEDEVKAARERRKKAKKSYDDANKERKQALKDAQKELDANPEKAARLDELVAKQVRAFVEGTGLDKGGTLTTEQAEQLARRIADSAVDKDLIDDSKAFRKYLQQRVPEMLLETSFDGDIQLEDTASTQYIRDIIDRAEKAGSDAQTFAAGTDLSQSGDLAGAQTKMAQLVKGYEFAKRAGNVPRELEIAIVEAGRELVEARVQAIEEAADRATARIAAGTMTIDQSTGQVRVDGGIDPRDSKANAKASLDDARRQLAAQQPGTTGFYEAVKNLREAQASYSEAVTEQAAAMLFRNLDVRDEIGNAEAEVAAADLRLRAARTGLDPTTSLTDFDLNGNPVGSVDIPAAGAGVGAMFQDGLFTQDYFATGASLAEQLVGGFNAVGVDGAPKGTPGGNLLEANQDVVTASAARDAAKEKLTAATKKGDEASIARAEKQYAAAERTLRTAMQRQKAAQGTFDTSTGRNQPVQVSGTKVDPNSVEVLEAERAKKEAEQRLRELRLQRDVAKINLNASPRSGLSRARAGLAVAERSLRDQLPETAAYYDGLRAVKEAQLELADQLRRADIAAVNRRVNPDSAIQKAAAALYAARRNVEGTDPGTAERDDAITARNEAQFAYNQAQIAKRNAVASASFDPRATVTAARVALANARRKLAGHTETTTAYYEDLAATRQAEVALINAERDRDIALTNSRVDPNNSLAKARAAVVNAQRNLRSQAAGTQGYFEAITQLNEARLADANARRERDNAARNAQVVRGGSPEALANARLRIATVNLRAQAKGTQEFFAAQAEFFSAQQEYAESLRQAYRRNLSLTTDITDPVIQARNDLLIAKRKQAENIRAGRDSGTQQQDRLDVKEAATALERADFDQRMADARTDFELRRSSQSQYVNFLQGEITRLGAIKNRTRQQQEMYDEAQRALNALNEQLTGQWNLGDIKVPTPYEMRRNSRGPEVTYTDPLRRPQGAAAAMAAMAGPSTASLASTVNNLDNSTTNVSVVINGGDLNQIKQVLNQYLGQTPTGAPRSTRRRSRRADDHARGGDPRGRPALAAARQRRAHAAHTAALRRHRRRPRQRDHLHLRRRRDSVPEHHREQRRPAPQLTDRQQPHPRRAQPDRRRRAQQ